jgi:hypothetical protein
MGAEHTSAPMKSPLVIALLAALAVVAAALALPLLHMLRGGAPAPPGNGLPWQVQIHGEGTSVFGLNLPGSTLGDARRRWGDGLQIALMAARGQAGALEGYVDAFDGGGVTGKLVLVTDLPAATLSHLRDNAVRAEVVDADARRYALRADDVAGVLAAPIAGITFIPAANLDAATLLQRFGEPAERRAEGARLEHWLYPARGLAIVLDTQGKEVLQYVAPADFERRLRVPLLGAGATPATDRPR